LTAVPAGNFVVPDGVDWLVDKATNQTLVFVDTTAATQSAQTASMEIILNGQLGLTNSDFALSMPLVLKVTQSAITLPKGGSVALPITISPLGLDATVAVSISGLASYETITDNLDHTTFSGGKSGVVTLTATEVDSGLSLNSSYSRSGTPVNTLSVTAADTTSGQTTSSQTIKVTDPPLSSDQSLASATIRNGGSLELPSGTSENVEFAGKHGTLQLDDPQDFSGLIAGFAGHDRVDLTDMPFNANTTLGYAANADNSGGNLIVHDGAQVANLSLLGHYMASSFVAASDGHGGIFVEPSPTLAQTPSLLAHPHA
jgi:hypothetical protein